MKKSFILFLTVLVFTLPVVALEWGGSIQNNSKVNSSDLKNFALDQGDAVSLWINKPLSADNSWNVSADVVYKFDYVLDNVAKPTTKSVYNIIDSDFLKLSGKIKMQSAVPVLTLGRFFVSDFTSTIFAQTCDGFSLSYATLKNNYNVYIGYTGLLNSLNVTMLGKDGVEFSSNKDFYALSHAYLPIMVNYENLSFLRNQTLGLQALAVLDAESSNYSRYYGTLSLRGPLFQSLYMSLSTTVGSENFKNIMNYSKLSFDYMNLGVLAVNAGVEYASGNNKFLKPFRTVTKHTAYNSAFYPELTGVITPSAKIMLTFSKFYAEAGGKYVLGFPESKIINEGFEVDGALIANVFSDLQLGVDIKYYYDMLNKGAANNATATLNLIFVF